ncbi:mycothiol-dependent nitroreductase Rv2466c family protein [Streptomyces erythrochromogenes]|uniref:mycothiol-dependent nitroreductase Rv2466c family protein n=1 Tax=Streptomyces erythrochromogenes TaxID=285574 RepID=UPI002253CF89|nr:disulfide bond formation protein DsbA [Streptomyces erythrochromogenes]MCX5582755.1 DsbA family protein [Streptomyces erythrochromogenes]
MTEQRTVDFWFDPVCPYTWITSRWLVEVTKVRPVTVHWRVMSLSVLNEHRDDNPEGEWEDYMWAPVRVCAAVEERFGQQALGDLFTAMGNRFHLQGDWGNLAGALADAGLPEEIAEVAGSTEYDGAVRSSHAQAVALAGGDIGTPVVSVVRPGGERVGFFGPVVSPAPTGETAGRLWDGLLLMAGVPGFYEVKRTRTEEPLFELAD